MNNLAPIRNCPCNGCKVGLISPRGLHVYMYEGHPINSGNFFIIRMLIRLAYQNYNVSMAKHVAHVRHYPKFISGQ